MHVYLDDSKTRAAGGQPLNAGISGAAALRELKKANGPGNLKDPAGIFVSSDDHNLPEGDYVFISAGKLGLHNFPTESLVLVHHLPRVCHESPVPARQSSM